MAEQDSDKPWEELERLVERSDPEQVEAFLDNLPAAESVRAISRLSEQGRERLLRELAPEDAADVVEQMPELHAAEAIERLEPETAALIVQELPSAAQADLLGDVGEAQAEAILAAMDPEDARDARTLRRYDRDVAGGLMVTEYLAYAEESSVARVIEDLRQNAERYHDYDVQYAYVTGASNQLTGVLRMRDLLLAPGDRAISGLMIRQPLTVRDTASLDELRDFFEKHDFFGVPVVDARHGLIGVVHRTALDEALAEREQASYQKSKGILGGEELRSLPLAVRSRRRLAWLSINIALNLVSASAVAAYQDTLREVIALAVFLPIISDMSGCSGNQAVAVSMRELSLGLVRAGEVLRVLLKEAAVGLLNGLALGAMIAGVAYVWKGSAWFGLVVGGALALNTLLAVCVGGTVPLLLKQLKQDPALASGPILTTITDMCGFWLVLGLATALLPHLTGL